jgi:hypothetical protein
MLVLASRTDTSGVAFAFASVSGGAFRVRGPWQPMPKSTAASIHGRMSLGVTSVADAGSPVRGSGLATAPALLPLTKFGDPSPSKPPSPQFPCEYGEPPSAEGGRHLVDQVFRLPLTGRATTLPARAGDTVVIPAFHRGGACKGSSSSTHDTLVCLAEHHGVPHAPPQWYAGRIVVIGARHPAELQVTPWSSRPFTVVGRETDRRHRRMTRWCASQSTMVCPTHHHSGTRVGSLSSAPTILRSSG